MAKLIGPLLISIALLFNIMSVFADTEDEIQIETAAGKLEVLRHIKDPRGFPDYSVVVGGKTVIGPDSQIKSIVASYPDKTPARLILLQIVSGGSGCPYSHQVLEVTDDRQILLSEEIGNCSLIVGKPIIRPDGWLIHFHPTHGRLTDSVIYEKGKVRDALGLQIEIPTYTVTAHIETALGTFELRDNYNPDDWYYRSSDALVRNKQLLHTSESPGLTLATRYPESGQAKLLLIREQVTQRIPNGPYYYVVDFTKGADPKMLKPFFTYGEAPWYTHMVKSAYEEGKWRIEFRERKSGVVRELWVYDGKEVVKTSR